MYIPVTIIYARSSVPFSLRNFVGIIDRDYRGELELRGTITRDFVLGDRVGQLIIMPILDVHLQEVQELSETERGHGGFGSTGK